MIHTFGNASFDMNMNNNLLSSQNGMNNNLQIIYNPQHSILHSLYQQISQHKQQQMLSTMHRLQCRIYRLILRRLYKHKHLILAIMNIEKLSLGTKGRHYPHGIQWQQIWKMPVAHGG